MLTTATAHDGDVNVISWSRQEPFLLSGGDDGALKVWDLRQFKVLLQPEWLLLLAATGIWGLHHQCFCTSDLERPFGWGFRPFGV